MKKLFLFSIILLVGCNKVEPSINIYDLSKKLDEIELTTLNIEKAVAEIEEDLLQDELIDVSSDIAKIVDFRELKQYVFYQNDDNYIFIYESDNHDITNIMDSYFTDLMNKQIEIELKENVKNKVEYQYENFYIYIVSDQADDMLKKVLDSKNTLFENTTTLSKDAIKEKLGVELENAIVKFSTKLDSEVGYLLIADVTPEIEEKCDDYFAKKTDELSKNRLKYKKDTVLIYVLSKDNNKALEIIENTNSQ